MYHLMKIKEGVARYKDQISVLNKRLGGRVGHADRTPMGMTIGTAGGIAGVHREGLVELSDATSGPFRPGNPKVSIEDFLSWIEPLASHFSGNYGAAELDRVIAPAKKGIRSSGADSAAVSSSQTPAAAPAAKAAATPPAKSKSSTSTSPLAARFRPQTDEGKRIVDATLAWKNNAALRAEFHNNPGAYFSHLEATAAGRVKHYGSAARPSASHAAITSAASSAGTPAGAQTPEQDRLLFHGSAALRAEFGGKEERFLAYQRAEGAGRVRHLGRRTGPARSARSI